MKLIFSMRAFIYNYTVTSSWTSWYSKSLTLKDTNNIKTMNIRFLQIINRFVLIICAEDYYHTIGEDLYGFIVSIWVIWVLYCITVSGRHNPTADLQITADRINVSTHNRDIILWQWRWYGNTVVPLEDFHWTVRY